MTPIRLLTAVALASVSTAAIGQDGRPPPPGQKKITVTMPAGTTPQAPIKIGGTGSGTGGSRPAPLISSSAAADKLLATPLAPVTYTWQRGQPPLQLPSAASHVCVLTKVSGKLVGFGERIALYIDTGGSGGPRWTLNGTSQQSELMAQATCAEKAKFVPAFSNPGSLTGKGYGNHAAGGCAPAIVKMNDTADRAYFISGIAGKFMGGGEEVAATRAGTAGAIRVKACSGAVDGTLLSLGIDGVPAKYRTQGNRTTNASQANFGIGQNGPEEEGFFDIGGPPFVFATPNGAYMVPVDEALCGLVLIKGKFQGYGEEATVTQAKGPDGRQWWRVQAQSQAEGSSMTAGARCFARDQR